eukprot:Partr_v1_DN14912_c0_g1_i1_m42891 putative PIF1 5'-to-3' DNA helicase homolog (S. cerevisiae)
MDLTSRLMKSQHRERVLANQQIRGSHQRGMVNVDGSEKLLNSSCTVDKILLLRVGAQVMLRVNDARRRLVNGSLGKMIGFDDISRNPRVSFTDGQVLTIKPHKFEVRIGEDIAATRLQLPLSLAWAMSILKSQGQTIEKLRVDFKHAFEYGQVYVALSRAVSLNNLQVLNFQRSQVKVKKRVLMFEYDLEQEEMARD